MENIKRNYIAITLLITSFILFFVEMKSGVIVNIMSIIAFGFTDQITKYISAVEKERVKEKEFYDAVEKYNNKILSKDITKS